jgi:hypothetical protein
MQLDKAIHGLAFLESLKRLDGEIARVTTFPCSLAATDCA